MDDQVMNDERAPADETVQAAVAAEGPTEPDESGQAAPAEEQSTQDPSAGGAGAESARFDDLDGEGEEGPEPSLDVILNIPVTLSMEVGRTRMTIRELMALKRGSVVRFDRLAGEPMDVLVNGTLVAHGEVVVVNDKFGIRLTDVISPEERVRKLR